MSLLSAIKADAEKVASAVKEEAEKLVADVESVGSVAKSDFDALVKRVETLESRVLGAVEQAAAKAAQAAA